MQLRSTEYRVKTSVGLPLLRLTSNVFASTFLSYGVQQRLNIFRQVHKCTSARYYISVQIIQEST